MILGIQALTVEPGVTNKLSWATVSSLASRMAGESFQFTT